MAQQVSLLVLQAQEPTLKLLAISWKPQACPSLHARSSSLLGRRQMDPRACWPIHLVERQASGSLSYSVSKGRRVMEKGSWSPLLDARFEYVHSLGWPMVDFQPSQAGYYVFANWYTVTLLQWPALGPSSTMHTLAETLNSATNIGQT